MGKILVKNHIIFLLTMLSMNLLWGVSVLAVTDCNLVLADRSHSQWQLEEYQHLTSENIGEFGLHIEQIFYDSRAST